jgi:tetratricopeptide (TPR) repeat protein
MYFEQGRVPEALGEIERAIRADRTLPQIWFYRGYIHWTMEQWEKAAGDFEESLELNPYYTDARMYLATCREKLGHPDEALAELDRALADRTFASVEQIHLNKALILRRMERNDEALAAFREAVTIRPRFYQAHFEMALLLAQMNRLDEAELAFAAAEPGYARDAEFHFARGEALFRMRRKPDAARELRRALELAPGSEAAARASALLKEL